jgi:hypothetical protein
MTPTASSSAKPRNLVGHSGAIQFVQGIHFNVALISDFYMDMKVDPSGDFYSYRGSLCEHDPSISEMENILRKGNEYQYNDNKYILDGYCTCIWYHKVQKGWTGVRDNAIQHVVDGSQLLKQITDGKPLNVRLFLDTEDGYTFFSNNSIATTYKGASMKSMHGMGTTMIKLLVKSNSFIVNKGKTSEPFANSKLWEELR